MSGQNTSSAVMQQRIEPEGSLDDFPTPPHGTRALCEWLSTKGMRPNLKDFSCREPAANRGYMVKSLKEYFGEVDASDIHDYGAGFPVKDYLGDDHFPPVDWTVTNPPFKFAEKFILMSLATSRYGVAMLTRTSFLESVGRYKRLFSVAPPTDVLQFTERLVIHKGKLSPKGSTATSYCWMVWQKPAGGWQCLRDRPTRLHWIPPSRKWLERDSDYPAEDAA